MDDQRYISLYTVSFSKELENYDKALNAALAIRWNCGL